MASAPKRGAGAIDDSKLSRDEVHSIIQESLAEVRSAMRSDFEGAFSKAEERFTGVVSNVVARIDQQHNERFCRQQLEGEGGRLRRMGRPADGAGEGAARQRAARHRSRGPMVR